MRAPFIGGNWKCNGTVESVQKLASDLLSKLSEISGNPKNATVVVAPSTVHISLVQQAISQALSSSSLVLQVAAQNINAEGPGAFTGETSAEMLKDMKIKYVILGHSERRHVYHESNVLIGAKVAKALATGLHVIPCVGEKLEEREAGKTFAVCEEQMKEIAKNVKSEDWEKVVLAYEPVWAIGTGKTASPEQAEEVHKMLREWIASNVSNDVAQAVRIIYGGSVTAKNAADLAKMDNVDGFLVGGASLKADDFATIIKAKL
eukprot:ANDGO_03784.mRNA.1 Triosephosphate isomerase